MGLRRFFCRRYKTGSFRGTGVSFGGSGVQNRLVLGYSGLFLVDELTLLVGAPTFLIVVYTPYSLSLCHQMDLFGIS